LNACCFIGRLFPVSTYKIFSLSQINCKTQRCILNTTSLYRADPRGRAVQDVVLRPLTCWDRKFEVTGGKDVCILSVLCCQVTVFASCLSLVQRIPTECGISECYLEALIMRRLWSNRDCCAVRRKDLYEGNVPVIMCSILFKSLKIKTKENEIQHKIYLNKYQVPKTQKTDGV
jgi:hypothetical protein